MQLPLLLGNIIQWTRVDCSKKLTKADLQCYNAFVFTFIKHLPKQRDVLKIGCLVEKATYQIVLIWATKFNFKQSNRGLLKFVLPEKL